MKFDNEATQIIPAPENLYFVQENEDDIYYIPIVCMALCANGDIAFCDTDDCGFIEVRLDGDIVRYDPHTNSYGPLIKIVEK